MPESAVTAEYESGNLDGAIEAALTAVKSKPADLSTRGLLAELFCFAGDWERADNQINTIGHQDPQAIVGLSLLRQLIRAEVSRAECFNEGRPPEVLAEPDGVIKLHLEGLAALREDDEAAAMKLLQEAEEVRVKTKGTCDGQDFDDFRDLDDTSAAFFEVLTSTGKYYWIPIERVRSIELQPAKRPRDVLWRQAAMDVIDGPEGEVFIPTIYPLTGDDSDSQLRLGRATDWIGGEGGPMRGVGQRMFLVGDNAVSLMQMTSIEFAG